MVFFLLALLIIFSSRYSIKRQSYFSFHTNPPHSICALFQINQSINWCEHQKTFYEMKEENLNTKFFLCPVEGKSNLHSKFTISRPHQFDDIMITRNWIETHIKTNRLIVPNQKFHASKKFRVSKSPYCWHPYQKFYSWNFIHSINFFRIKKVKIDSFFLVM